MPLSWNEIKSRAIQFSKEWENEKAEHAEAKTFWDDFFNVFGIHRRRVPENPTDKQTAAIEQAAQKVLDVRKEFEGSSLADLYDPVAMPPKLTKAHQDLDKAVDLAYRPQPFTSETKRIEFLFELYEKYTSGLFGEKKKGRN